MDRSHIVSNIMEEDINTPVICVTGANGFIGESLVRALAVRGEMLIRTLSRRPDSIALNYPNVTVIQGDLKKPETFTNFLIPRSTMVNLAYNFSATSAENLALARNLVETCREYKIKRFIHCSTAAVFGRNREDVVNEETSCNPQNEYGVTKLLIEQILHEGSRGYYEYVNLRPTTVFGPDRQALARLITRLRQGSMILNFLRSCLFSTRKMNLVNVDTVTAAIIFLAEAQQGIDGETFIISEDNEPNNNFRYVERYLLNTLVGRDYMLPRIEVPLVILSLLLRMLGREVNNPRRIYDSSKIQRAGFHHFLPLEHGLAALVKWYQSKSVPGPREGM